MEREEISPLVSHYPLPFPELEEEGRPLAAGFEEDAATHVAHELAREGKPNAGGAAAVVELEEIGCDVGCSDAGHSQV